MFTHQLLARALFGLAITAGLTADCFAQPGNVDTARSRVYVYVGKTGAGHIHGVEGTLAAGHLSLDPAGPGGKLVFDMHKFAADTPAARKLFKLDGEIDAHAQGQVNANMLGEAVLYVDKFPTAEFVVRRVQSIGQPDGARRYQLDGDFLLHGVQRPVTIIATAETIEGMTRLRGRLVIKQTDYGIKPFSKFLGAVGVTDELQILGEIWLRP